MELKRSLGPVSLTLYGVGVTLGAGIYVLIGETAGARVPTQFGASSQAPRVPRVPSRR